MIIGIFNAKNKQHHPKICSNKEHKKIMTLQKVTNINDKNNEKSKTKINTIY